LLLGNYLILDKLGAGGMGQVYRARHRRMDRVVALKVLSKKSIDTPGSVARFQREVKAAAKLTHPNIVAVFDADEAGGVHFYVMEYIEGSDLASLVKRGGPLTMTDAVNYATQAAGGLAVAHAKGLVHRDIKPANVVLSNDGVVKILDLGLARFNDPLGDPNAAGEADLTQSGSIMGTIDYMAPEQAMDCRQADARSDIYSLGCTLHFLLAGRPPFSGDTLMKRLAAHQQNPIPVLSAVRADVPGALQAVFSRMLAKLPASRFQTMDEVQLALRTCLQGAPPVPRPLAPLIIPAAVSVAAASGLKDFESIALPAATRKGRRRPKRASMAIAAVVVAVVAGGGIALWPRSRAETLPVTANDDEQPAGRSPSVPVKPEPVSPSPVQSEVSAAPQTAASSVAQDEAPPAAAEAAPVVAPAPPASATAAGPAPVAAAAEMPKPSESTTPASEPPASPVPSELSPSKAGPSETASDGRRPIPSAESQQNAVRLLHEIFKDDYASAKDTDGRVALAKKLWNASQQNSGDATAQFVVLGEVRDLAIELADPALAEQVTDELARVYQDDPSSDLAATFEAMIAKTHPPAANKAVADAAIKHVQAAISEQQFESAKRFAQIALAAGRKARDAALLKQTVEWNKRVGVEKQQWDEFQAALAKLKATPDDPHASQAAGRYLCFVAEDWAQGLAMLARGVDGALKDLARQSLPLPENPAELASLGDAWWNAAEKSKGAEKADLQAGAGYWYSRAEPDLTGLTKTMVSKRLSQLKGKTPSAVRGIAKVPTANGLWLAQTFDCSTQAHRVELGPGFDITKNWTLSLEFMPTNLDRGNHLVFFWGDGRSGRDPLFVGLNGAKLQATVSDSGA
ncbi:MAG TPA: serine/threonine-protein kinase, partial [Pirellulales bacterium]